MAVSIRELLGDVRDHLDAISTVDAEYALMAVSGLAPIGRALDRLYGCRPHIPGQNEAQPPQALALTQACLDAGRCWPNGAGRMADLLGVTADIIGRSAPSFTSKQRWALTEALAETARRCTDSAQRFQPYATIPELAAVRAAAVACERHASELPVSAADRTALDHLVPARHTEADPTARIVDAAAALHLALTRRQYLPRLDVAEVVITLNAAQLATAHAAAALREATDSDGLPGLAAPDAWRAARGYCASFDDGTKMHPPDGSPVASAAARLGRGLLDHLGSAVTPTAGTALTEPGTLQALQTVTGLLPDVAKSLDYSIRLWPGNRRVWAQERRLLSYEERNEAVISTDRAARADWFDLEPLAEALGSAARLTSALASELAHHSPAPARQPYLSEAHTSTTRGDHSLSIRAGSARDAVRRAQALHPTEWALPTWPRAMRANQTADHRDQDHDPIRRARLAVHRVTSGREQLERRRSEHARSERLPARRRDHHCPSDGWDVGR